MDKNKIKSIYIYLWKKKYLTNNLINQSYFINNLNNAINYILCFILITIFIIISKFDLDKKFFSYFEIFFNILILNNLFFLILCYYRFIYALKHDNGVIISNYTKNTFKILPFLIFIGTVFWIYVFGNSIFNMFIGNYNKENQYYAILLICYFTLIKGYGLDFIIVFTKNYFLSGELKFYYNTISKIEIIKELNTFPESSIIFLIYSNDICIGFDKFAQSDYNYLYQKIKKAL